MAHLALVTTTAPKPAPTTDTRLLKACRQYQLEAVNLRRLQDMLTTARRIAEVVLRDPPDDPDAAALWRQCWESTPASHLSRGVGYSEKRLEKLLTEIAETPARTEAGLRARMQVWRMVLAADDADRMLDSIISDCCARRRKRA